MNKKKISDYDKYNYDYTEYWSGKNIDRRYEDVTERAIIKKLLPQNSNWHMDLGAGFGRLFDTYKDKSKNIILADYSLENLKKARDKIISKDPKSKDKIYFIALNAYHIPLKDNCLDSILSVRMMHHIERPEEVFAQIKRIIKPRGKVVLEYANKRHFFEIIKALLGKSKMKPFSQELARRGDLFYNFHPKYIEKKFEEIGFKIIKSVSASNFRHNIFKRILGTKILVFLDNILRPFFSVIKFGPSIFVLAQKKGGEMEDDKTTIEKIIVCPRCKEGLVFSEKEAKCKKCKSVFKIVDNIYDFRI